MDFAHNTTFDQAFVSGAHGLNRPTNVRMGPDGCAWIVDYGAVRDFGQGGPELEVRRRGQWPVGANPGTGAIFRICPEQG